MSLAELLPRRGMEMGHAEPAPAPEPVVAPAAPSTLRHALVGGVVGAICGVAASIVTVFVWSYLHPAIDQRLDGVAQRVVAVETGLKDLNTSLAPVQAEMAGFYDVTKELSGRLDAADGQTAALLDEFENALTRQADVMSVGSPVFAVAVAQLRAAALSGEPFEAELLNVYALSNGDPEVKTALEALVNASRTGIASTPFLRQWLATAAAAAGIGVGDRATAYDYGVSMLANYVGFSSEAYTKGMSRALIVRADQQLAAGDLAGARETMRGVDQAIADKFSLWNQAIDARLAEDAAVDAVDSLVRSTISDKLLQDGGSAG